MSKPEADLRLPSLLGAPLAWAVEQKAAKIQPGAEVRRAGVKRLEVGTAGLGSGTVLLGAFADREVRIRPPILGAQRCGPQVLVADVRRGLAAAAGSQRHPPRPPARRDPGRVRLGYHMHVFTSGADEFGVPDPELGFMDERRVSLGQLIGGAGDRLGYTYDFGDAWEHEIVVEELLDANPEVHYPVLVAAKGACPPEDCGGPWGYAELKEILADPTHDQHQEMLTWLGLDDASGFDPSGLAVDEIEEELALSAADR